MRQNRQIRQLVAGAFLLAGMGAWAQGPGNQPRLVLKALDTDGDGTLSAAEIAGAPKSLLTLDRSADGQITADEVSPRREDAGASSDQLVKQLMALDKNGDGVLTADELPARMQSLMDRADLNHDGKITPAELATMANRQTAPAGAQGGNGERRDGAMRNDPLLAALDTDHDGVISAAEIAAAPSALKALDRNGDGQITPDEMRPRQQTPEERVNHLLGEWDTNKDGKLSKAEMPDRMQAQFEAVDTNHDGFADRDELLAYYKANPGMGQRGGGQGPQGGQQLHGEHN